MTKLRSGIILEGEYLDSFLGVALREDYISFQYDSHEDKGTVEQYKKKLKASRFKSKSLELALLFDHVHLHAPHELVKFNKLQKEGIIKTSKPHPFLNELTDKEVEDFIISSAIFKSNLVSSIEKEMTKRISHLTGIMEAPSGTKKFIGDFYDFVTLMEAGIPEVAVNFLSIPLREYLNIRRNPLKGIRKIFYEAQLGKYHWIVNLFLEIENEILSLHSLLDMSRRLKIPFASRKFITYREKKEIDATHSAFELCQLSFREEIKYAPVVDSIEDLLRLREKKEIKRFREVFNEWREMILKGDIDTAEKIRLDISKANKEINKLEKWRKVDKWLSYFAIPVVFVPIISNLVAILTLVPRFHIKRNEGRFGWIAIAR